MLQQAGKDGNISCLSKAMSSYCLLLLLKRAHTCYQKVCCMWLHQVISCYYEERLYLLKTVQFLLLHGECQCA